MLNALDKKELEIINHAWDSWFEAVVSHAPHREVAHKAKRFKYLIDWASESIEVHEKENKNVKVNLMA
jgi:chemotaxis regulatin CheY-phosphate phosphatase CheZ|tara:strand:+ start:899 stop:1102 length:204 start_codon:yes stop_codon:yes gene_type:complete